VRAQPATAILASVLATAAVGLSVAGCGGAGDGDLGPAAAMTTSQRPPPPRPSRLSAGRAQRLRVATRRFLGESRGFLAPIGHRCAALVAARRLHTASACYDRAYAGVEPAAAGLSFVLDELAGVTARGCATSLRRTRALLARVTRSLSALHRVAVSLGEDDGAYGAQIGRVVRQRLTVFRAASGQGAPPGCSSAAG